MISSFFSPIIEGQITIMPTMRMRVKGRSKDEDDNLDRWLL
jgi:hypothetical protein